MFRITALPAGRGDCIWVEYGSLAEGIHHLVIDCGLPDTLPELKRRLKEIPDGGIEALVITHIDDDHIGSALQVLKDRKLSRKFKDIWFNGRKHCGAHEELESLGVRSAVPVEALLAGGTLPWNSITGGSAISLDVDGAPVRLPILPGGLKVTVLGPTRRQLEKLARLWDKGVDALRESGKLEAVLAEAVPDEMETLGAPEPDVEGLAKGRAVDASVTNGSSIALLLEFEGRRALLAGDAHAATMVTAMRRLACAQVDFLKVSHHGSRNNTSLVLAKLLSPRKVLVSTDGSIHGHPDDECIARLVSAPGRRTIYCNFDREPLSRWKSRSLQAKYEFELCVGDKGVIAVDVTGCAHSEGGCAADGTRSGEPSGSG